MSEKKDKGKEKFSFAAFDMFGSPVQFNIRGDETYKTIIGCFWTGVMLVSLVGAFIWYFMIFVKHKDGSVSSTVETQDEYPMLDFYDKGFFLSLSAIREKQVVNLANNNTLFKIEAAVYNITRDDGDATKPPTYYDPIRVPLLACDVAKPSSNRTIGKPDEDGNSYTLEGVTSNQLTKNDLCTIPGEDNPLEVKGADDSSEFTYVRIKVSPCDPELFSCIMFYEETKINSYFNENSEANPLFNPGLGPNPGNPDKRISSKFVCNTLFRPPARIFHAAYTGADKTVYDELIEDYANNSCDCGQNAPSEYFTYSENLSKSQKNTTPGNRGEKMDMCIKIYQDIRTKLDGELAKTTFKIAYTEGSVKPDQFDKPFKFFLKTAASIRGS